MNEDTLIKQNQSLIDKMIKEHRYLIRQYERNIDYHYNAIKELELNKLFLEEKHAKTTR